MRTLKRLLVAAAPESILAVSRALESHFTLIGAGSVAEAQSRVVQGIDLILCGLHFDEGRMFDLLRYVKANPATKSIPFLCIKSGDGTLSPALLESVEIASKALGADGFVVLHDWKKDFGDDAAYEKLRHLINRLIR